MTGKRGYFTTTKTTENRLRSTAARCSYICTHLYNGMTGMACHAESISRGSHTKYATRSTPQITIYSPCLATKHTPQHTPQCSVLNVLQCTTHCTLQLVSLLTDRQVLPDVRFNPWSLLERNKVLTLHFIFRHIYTSALTIPSDTHRRTLSPTHTRAFTAQKPVLLRLQKLCRDPFFRPDNYRIEDVSLGAQVHQSHNNSTTTHIL